MENANSLLNGLEALYTVWLIQIKVFKNQMRNVE